MGPVLGGVFTDKVTWRWCFYINLPFGTITVAAIIFLLQNPHRKEINKTIKQRLNELDFLGPIFFIPAIICILLALQWGGSLYPWKSPIIIGLCGGFAGFIAIWLYCQFRLGERATIPLRIFGQRTVVFSSMYGFFATSAFMIPIFYIPLYFQAVKDTSATASAIDTSPFIGGVTLTSIGVGFILSLVGYFTPFMIIGAAMLALGTGLLSTLRVDTSVGQWLGYQITAGIGAGLILQVLIDLTKAHLIADAGNCSAIGGFPSRYPHCDFDVRTFSTTRTGSIRCSLRVRPFKSVIAKDPGDQPDSYCDGYIAGGRHGVEDIGDRVSTANCFSVICRRFGSDIQADSRTVDGGVYSGIWH